MSRLENLLVGDLPDQPQDALPIRFSVGIVLDLLKLSEEMSVTAFDLRDPFLLACRIGLLACQRDPVLGFLTQRGKLRGIGRLGQEQETIQLALQLEANELQLFRRPQAGRAGDEQMGRIFLQLVQVPGRDAAQEHQRGTHQDRRSNDSCCEPQRHGRIPATHHTR